ncbi:MAG: phosphohistidine phosphatase [Gammaproteobacteria bacterium]|jgi:phosphohistidine phosphatase
MGSDQNHQLIIMRHAKSDWVKGNKHDFDRSLSERGNRDAKKVALWIVEQNLMPDIIVVSPARRAKETADIVCNILGFDYKNIHWTDAIYEARLGDLLKILEDKAKQHKTILVIGHNPGMDNLLCYLSENEPEFTPSGKLLTTSAIAVLEYKNRWVETEPQSATLISLIRPKEL